MIILSCFLYLPTNGDARSKSMRPFKIPFGVPMLSTKNPRDSSATHSCKQTNKFLHSTPLEVNVENNFAKE